MNQLDVSEEFASHAHDCTNVLGVLYHLLLSRNRNFDASVVRTCIDLLNSEFSMDGDSTGMFKFPAASASSGAAGDPNI